MDGTLIDSSEYHWLTWQEALGWEGLTVTREAFVASFGRRNDAVLRHFLGEEVAEDLIARISANKEERFRELVRTAGIEPLPGARRWLARLNAGGWRQAIASSAPRDNVTAILDALGLAGLRSEEHTSELQSLAYLVCRLLLEKKKQKATRLDLSKDLCTLILPSHPVSHVALTLAVLSGLPRGLAFWLSEWVVADAVPLVMAMC